MEGLPYCNLYRSKFGDQKWVLLGFNQRQEDQFCINYQDYGHSACYTKCPKFPSQRREPLLLTLRNREISPVIGLKRTSFANVVSGEAPIQTPIEN
ncbi:hypothetical protein TNCV_4143421 [Trichonephila clavipes]|nr:hypothetical protein TNCV_4143421 [Trichonephila clavipes]